MDLFSILPLIVAVEDVVVIFLNFLARGGFQADFIVECPTVAAFFKCLQQEHPINLALPGHPMPFVYVIVVGDVGGDGAGADLCNLVVGGILQKMVDGRKKL